MWDEQRNFCLIEIKTILPSQNTTLKPKTNLKERQPRSQGPLPISRNRDREYLYKRLELSKCRSCLHFLDTGQSFVGRHLFLNFFYLGNLLIFF